MKLQHFYLWAKNHLAVWMLLLWVVSGFAQDSLIQKPSQENLPRYRTLSRMMIPGTRELQLIIELSDPGILERMLADKKAINLHTRGAVPQSIDFGSERARLYRQEIDRAQQEVKKRIAALSGAEILATTDTVMNAIIVRIPAEHYDAVRKHSGVRKIYFSRPHRLLLDKTAVIHRAAGIWAASGGQSEAGKGIKIGIIDSGIDITNPMFVGTGLSVPAGYPKYDTLANRSFTNQKVIGGNVKQLV